MEIKPVLIIGADWLGQTVLECFETNGMLVYGFLDERAEFKGLEIGALTVLGDPEEEAFFSLMGSSCDVFIASEDVRYRKKMVELILEERKVMPINAVHGKAWVSERAVLHNGTYIGPYASIQAMANIGNHCLIHSGALIESGVQLADNVQVGAGSILNAGVKVEEGAFIGSGAIVVAGVTIGKNARIGAGSVVIKNVPAKSTVFGNPAEAVKA
jgi:sugar O-acyltransferase (sialic acid O-acetyltransferase NeuD family)